MWVWKVCLALNSRKTYSQFSDQQVRGNVAIGSDNSEVWPRHPFSLSAFPIPSTQSPLSSKTQGSSTPSASKKPRLLSWDSCPVLRARTQTNGNLWHQMSAHFCSECSCMIWLHLHYILYLLAPKKPPVHALIPTTQWGTRFRAGLWSGVFSMEVLCPPHAAALAGTTPCMEFKIITTVLCKIFHIHLYDMPVQNQYT